jgi:hypothetical protein
LLSILIFKPATGLAAAIVVLVTVALAAVTVAPAAVTVSAAAVIIALAIVAFVVVARAPVAIAIAVVALAAVALTVTIAAAPLLEGIGGVHLFRGDEVDSSDSSDPPSPAHSMERQYARAALDSPMESSESSDDAVGEAGAGDRSYSEEASSEYS